MGRSNFFRNLNLGIKLNGVVVLAMALLLLAIMIVGNRSIRDLAVRSGLQRAEEETELIRSHVEEIEQELLREAKLLAATPGLVDVVAAKDISTLKAIALGSATSLNFDTINITDATHRYLLAQNDDAQVDSLIPLGLLGAEASKAFINKVTGDMSIAAVVPLRHQDSANIVGTLIVSRQLDNDFMATLNFDRSEIHLVLITDGQVIAQHLTHSGLEVQDQDNLTSSREFPDLLNNIAVEQAARGETVVLEEFIYNTETKAPYAIAYMPFPVDGNTESVVAVLVSQTAVTGFQSQLINNLGLIVGLLIVIMIGGLTYFVRSNVATPLNKLEQVAEQMAAGDYSQSLNVITEDEIGRLTKSFNDMGTAIRVRETELRELTSALRERTKALETSADISRQVTNILDLDELLHYVVHRIQEEFDFYHVQVYLIEEDTGDLIMAQGSGEVGEQLKIQGHKLERGQGIVGTVASTNDYFLSNNVDDVLNFIRNPLLQDTNSELATPMRKGDQVIGVLDIQSRRIGRFTDEHVSLAQSLADQIAIAIDNIRLLQTTQSAIRDVERLNRRLTKEGWDETVEEAENKAFRFVNHTSVQIRPAPNAWSPPMAQAAMQKQLVTQSSSGFPGSSAELAVPLILRGEVIGVIEVKRQETPTWREEEIAAVEAVASQTALALESARLAHEQEKTIVQLRGVDRLKSEFLTSMSHELRTPLNSIIGFADILIQGIDGPLTDQALTDISAIHNSGKHLLALINDLLDLSKIEAGRMELANDILSISDVFNEVAGSVSSLLTKKEIDLVIDIREELPDTWADPLRISQVLINLVSNAIKFTEEGKVTLHAHVNSDQMMQIAVEDTGIGIPKEKFDLVFEHFRQVDARTNRKFQGTGMGLAIAKQLAELHGGEMWLDSVEGQGTTFFFTVPLAANNSM